MPGVNIYVCMCLGSTADNTDSLALHAHLFAEHAGTLGSREKTGEVSPLGSRVGEANWYSGVISAE